MSKSRERMTIPGVSGAVSVLHTYPDNRVIPRVLKERKKLNFQVDSLTRKIKALEKELADAAAKPAPRTKELSTSPLIVYWFPLPPMTKGFLAVLEVAHSILQSFAE